MDANKTTWQAGDKAYCLKSFNICTVYTAPNGVPKGGCIYLVSGVFVGKSKNGLILSGFPVISDKTGNDVGCSEDGFKKVITRTDREKANKSKGEQHKE